MNREGNIIVGISIGDLNGIGAEIVLKTFEDSRMLDFCTPVIFASAKVINFYKKHFNYKLSFNSINKLDQIAYSKVNVFNCWNDNVSVQFGKEDIKIGELAIKSLQSATKALKGSLIDVLVTAPINKHNIQSDKFKFPGHTDYLNQELEGNSLMLMVANGLRVGLLTDHVPIKDVTNVISPELIKQKINTIYKTLQQDFRVSKPKIAVLGINPHTGDNGVIGFEDDKTMRPTIVQLKEEGKLIFGPYAADSFFGSDNYKNFDAIIASYHDQGLIPFKTLSFGQGVNFTAGLNKIRTSPDHGTAYEIAGKGVADNGSFKEAFFTAIRLFKNRQEFSKLTRKPLKKATKKI